MGPSVVEVAERPPQARRHEQAQENGAVVASPADRQDALSPYPGIHSQDGIGKPHGEPDTRIKQNATANQYVSFVRRVIRHGSNLKPAFQVYPPMLGSERWATQAEWKAISKHLTPDALDVLTFLLVTGQREANVMFFEWKWDHGTWGTVPAADTKTSVPYGIPFNQTAQA